MKELKRLAQRAAITALALVLIPIVNVLGACVGPLDEEPAPI